MQMKSRIKENAFEIILYITLVPVLTFFSAVFNKALLQRYSAEMPGYPSVVTLALKGPDMLMIQLNQAGPEGIMVLSLVCFILIIISLFVKGNSYRFYMRCVLITNIVFLCMTLIIYIINLLRLVPV